MQLLYEKRKGKESAFHPYIQELPRSFDMPLQWSEKEMDELHYPCLNVMVRASVACPIWLHKYADQLASIPFLMTAAEAAKHIM